jgi:hypothetical protein
MRAKLVKENFDSQEAKEKFGKIFSKDDLAKMADLKPYKNKFSYGAYHGEDSSNLNVLLNQAEFGEFDEIGFIETAYDILINKIPALKSFKVNDQHFESKTHFLNLQKEIPIKDESLDDDYSVKVNIWLTYITKNDRDLNYKKHTLKFLFSPNITVSRTSIGMGELGKIGKKDPLMDGSLDKIDWENIDNDKELDNVMDKIQKALYGTIDDEDKYFRKKLEISKKNLSVQGFVKLIPQLEENLKFFANYVKKKYNVSIL